MIKINNLSFFYSKDKKLFENVSFSLKEKGLSCIIGPNGCGKSTFIKIISGIIDNYKGEVLIDGKNLKDLSLWEISQNISYLPQSIVYDPNITVIESLISVLSKNFIFEPNPKQKKEIEKIINDFSLFDIKDKKLSEISGGEIQRVFIAMASLKKSKIYVFDEPLNNLDIKNQLDIMNRIKLISYEKTVLTVVHDINIALKFADEIVFMKDAKILYRTEPMKVDRFMIKDVFGIENDIINLDKNKIMVCV